MDRLALYRELTEAAGAPGFEDDVRAVMRRHLAPLADSVTTDRIGSIIARKVGLEEGPRILLGAHMDEVGFMVTRMTAEGYLKFQPLGGWSEQVMPSMRVTVHTREGVLHGVVGSKPSHTVSPEKRMESVAFRDLYIDIGVSGSEEAKEAGVRPGDWIVPYHSFTVMRNPDYMMAKAWDNRFGCAAVIEVMKQLAGIRHPNMVYGVGTVQEEVGLRGAATSVSLVKPDLAIAVDASLAGDTPDMHPEDSTSRLGGGPVIGLLDKSTIAHRRFKELVMETAERENIPLQFDVMLKGSTDAGSFHLHDGGVPSLHIGVPLRYIHSASSIIHRQDIDACVTLLTALIRRLDRSTVDALTAYS